MAYAQLVFGVLLVSAAITYAWWVRVRTILLRQDIYDIRDELFDQAAVLGAFNDPAYCAARIHLNGLARVAPHLNGPVMIAIQTDGYTVLSLPKTSNKALTEKIDVAFSKCGVRIFRYILYETITGTVGRLLRIMFRVDRALEGKVNSRVGQIVNSDAPEAMNGMWPAT